MSGYPPQYNRARTKLEALEETEEALQGSIEPEGDEDEEDEEKPVRTPRTKRRRKKKRK